ncbi:MAG: hypothetical protein Q9168_003856 [Polycauliona sp. 1 TL-2023]
MGSYLSPQEVAHQVANFNDNRGPALMVSTVVLAVLATAAVLLRFISRRVTKMAISWDDGLIVVGVDSGAGKHVLAAGGEKKVIRYIKVMYAYQMFWAVAMAFIKVSILLFYRRVFPSTATSRTWGICNYALMFASVAFCLISLFGSAFACTPVSFIWDRTIQDGHCINLIGLARFTCITGVLTDILILTLPMPIVWNMHMKRSKKVAVSGVFLLGSFVCVASMIRFYYLEQINRDDPTWGNVNSTIWTTIESSVGIISACLPVMAPFLRTKVAAVATSIFRSKKSLPSSETFNGHGVTDAHKEKRGFLRLGRAKPTDAGSSKTGSDVDPEMGVDPQGSRQEPQAEENNEGNVGVDEVRL